VVTFPTLCFHEQNLVIHGNGWGCLNYWRAGVGLAPRPDAAPIFGLPHGATIVAYITQAITGGHHPRGYPLRCFYLSCLGPDGYIDGLDYPGKDDQGILVRPDSVMPRVPQCERPMDFQRRSRRGQIELRLAAMLRESKKAWQQYADSHGFVLPPDHREVFSDRIPF
jgi:hypothetical protein